MHTQKKYNIICMEKKNSGEKINEMSESEVSSDESYLHLLILKMIFYKT